MTTDTETGRPGRLRRRRAPGRRFALPALLLGGALLARGAARPREIPDCNLLDLYGRNHELRRVEGQALVLFFTGNGCPIARQSIGKVKELRQHFGTNVTFWVVNSFPDDSLRDCRREYRDFDFWPLTYLRDPNQKLALVLGVQRTAEVVALSTRDWSVLYQGAVDDQLSEGAQRAAPHRAYLASALTEFLAGKTVTTPRTQAHGCLLSFADVAGSAGTVSYSRQVAPLLRAHCAECHREGGIGPWAMTGYPRVKNYARMIEEVVLTGRMPPWHADPDHGHWANDRALSRDQVQTLLQWVEAGAPRGDGPDPLAAPLPPGPDWPLGRPDFIVRLPQPESIPANGVLDYRYVTLDLPSTNTLWLAGVDIRPGNRRVVHHVIVRAEQPHGPDDGSGHGVMLAGWAPGLANALFPPGTGERVPAGAKLNLELHYTTIGVAQTDQTEVAFYLLPGPPRRELTTRRAIQTDLNIAPGVDDARDVAVYGFERPATIYTLMPHLHLRGKWMQFDLLLPNGRRETLLNVPRYDFNWQTIYRFAQPRHVPAGAWLLVTGGFDNSADNPANPDPTKRIHFGRQSWDEMFIGFFSAADDPPPTPRVAAVHPTGP